MQLGIDFGTTNSGIAHFQQGQLTPIQADPTHENPNILPSLLYITRQLEQFVGIRAAQEYLTHETGRQVKWEKRSAGEVEIVVSSAGSGPMMFAQELNVMMDVAAYGRLLQSIKTALRDPGYEGTQIFDRFYSIDELICIILKDLKVKAEAQLGETCDSIVLGRPVKFSDTPTIDTRAEEILYKAAKQAGYDKITFATEPLAVAYLHHVNSPQRHLALIFDFGGGTLDFTVAELGGSTEPNILASHGVLVGGDDLDRAVMKSLLKYFGKGSKINGHPFPEEMLDLLLSWQTMPELSRPQYMSEIFDFKAMSNKPQLMDALQTLVTRNLGYKLFREIERAKRELSDSIVTRLNFEYQAIKINEVITRTQFESMIGDEVKKVREGVLTAMQIAGVQADQIDVVLRTGGSSMVPVFSRMLAEIFGENKVRSIDALTSVVGGMAVIAATETRPTPPYAHRYEQMCVRDVQNEGEKIYQIKRLYNDERCYVDIDSLIRRTPAILNGLPMICTANSDRDANSATFLRFTLDTPATVYIAYPAGVKALPKWLRSFQSIGGKIETANEWTGDRTYNLYIKDMPAGEVVLGGSKAAGYQGGTSPAYFVIVRAQ